MDARWFGLGPAAIAIVVSSMACSSSRQSSGTTGAGAGTGASVTSVSVGSAPTSSNAVGSGGAGGATSSVGSGGGGGACMFGDMKACLSGQYCDSPNCGPGVCKNMPTQEDSKKDIVCGCDGVAYWNASVAAMNAMSLVPGMACMKTCGGFGGLQCDSGLACDYGMMDQSGCNVSDQSGFCVMLPASCTPEVGIGPQTRGCGEALCDDACTLVQLGKTYYPDPTCPQ